MDLSFIIHFILFIFFQSNVQSQQDLPNQSSASVETQYLTFDMAQYGIDGGVFSSPNFPDYYPRDTILFYQFKGSLDYRVQVEIDFFHVRGVPPQCTHDYLDVFLNITDLNLIDNMFNEQLLYRYCGRNKPPLLISLTNLLVLGFFTEDTQTERGFNGSFRFISAKNYRKNLQRTPCDYLFDSSISKRGDLFSSTYPGTYLPWQFCNYSFIGQPNERIRIRFRDLMLFKTPNTQHCAVDLIKLYDNTLNPPDLQRFLSSFRSTSNSHPESSFESRNEHHISDLCGTYTMPLDVYSTSNRLLFYFIATHYAELTVEEQNSLDDLSRSIWRKGFYAEYEFSSALTKLDFIGTNHSNEYLSGTECDQTIKSFSQGSGKIRSPNWPNFYKPQTSCTTYFLGLDDRFTLENVEIEFEHFDIDCQIASLIIYNASRIYDYRFRHPTSTSLKSSLFSNYYQQDLDFKSNLTFCGHFKPEGRFLSKNALLKLVFIPNDYHSDKSLPSLVEGGKFQAKYRFVKSYHQVTADEYDGLNPSACSFFFYQSRTPSGKFHPPRSSENDYFANSNCTFHFHRLNEHSRLLIWYDYFNIADENYTVCPSDNLTYTYRMNSSLNYQIHPFVYCGYRNFPSPYLTDRLTKEFRIHFRSNNDLDSGLGFDGRYQFINQSNSFISSSCRTPFDSIIFINETEQVWGNLTSNGYPENVICEWSYRTNEGYQFNLDLTILQIEGSQTKDPPQGCQSAVLRIFSEGSIKELCGTLETSFYFLTNSNWFTVQFLSFNRQTKEQLGGFHLNWLIIEIPSNRNSCSLSNQFLACEKSSSNINASLFCIDQRLICNKSIQCQSLIEPTKLPLNCFEMNSSNFHLKSSRFFREHFILILIIVLLSIVILIIGLILILLIIQNKRTNRQHHFSREMKTKLNDQDSMGMSMLEQTVTTV